MLCHELERERIREEKLNAVVQKNAVEIKSLQKEVLRLTGHQNGVNETEAFVRLCEGNPYMVKERLAHDSDE